MAINKDSLVDPNTLEFAIRQGALQLSEASVYFGHGTDNAIDEAAWLVLHALGLSPVDPVDYAQILTDEQREAASQLIAMRIKTRKPAAYLTGTMWFAGLEFHCDERALVPRSPIAEYIMEGFASLLDPSAVSHVLDLCTGGGCIAIACAYAFPEATVDGADLSCDALALASENCEMHDLEDRLTLFQGDLFEPLEGRRYDLIVSNPPYVDAKDMEDAADEFFTEPKMGLVAGADGLDIVRRILNQAPDFLTDEGWLVVEVGNSANAVVQTWPNLPLLWLDFEQGGIGVFAIQRDMLLLDEALLESN